MKILIVCLIAFTATLIFLGPASSANPSQDDLSWPDSWVSLGEARVRGDAPLLAWDSALDPEAAMEEGLRHFNSLGLAPVAAGDKGGALIRFGHERHNVIISFSPIHGGGTEITAIFRPRSDKGVAQ